MLLLLEAFPVFSKHFEYSLTDLKFNLRSQLNREPSISEDIVMVNLDDYSKAQSEYDLWPYEYYAETIEKINDGDPTSLGIDIFFTLSVDTLGWKRLLAAVENSYVSINPFLVEYGEESKVLNVSKHSEILSQLEYEDLPKIDQGLVPHAVDIRYKTKRKFMDASAGLGIININEDEDGIVRRLPILSEVAGILAPHFYFRLLCEHINYDLSNIQVIDKHKLILNNFPINDSLTTVEVPLDGYGNMLINYISYSKIEKMMLSGKFYSVSAWDLLKSNKPVQFDNKAVIFGDTSVPAKDHSITPMDIRMFNPLIYAIAISNILNAEFIQPASNFINFLVFIILFGLLFGMSVRLDVFRYGIISFGLLLLYFIINCILFIYFNIHANILGTLLPLLLSMIYLMTHKVYVSQVKMGVLEGSLQSFLSPPLMEQIKNDPDMMKLGGERKRISVLFSDIVGFTSFTDKADPAEVQAVLEEYFSEMAAIVFKRNGIVDKFLGDGILAFFENPKDGVVSPQLAVKTAISMKEKAKELDQKYKQQKRFPFSICVGIATGYAKVGNIGPPEKIDYTIIGSVVNKASRLDGPGDPGDILMDEDTYFFVKDDYDIDNYGSHSLKGFESPVKVYRLK